MLKQIILILAIATTILPAVGRTSEERLQIIEELKKELPKKTTARDSLRILYDIFDLGTKKVQKEVVWQLYETAGRANDLNSQTDMLRQMSVLYNSNDSILMELDKMADLLPNDDAREATSLFIKSQWLNRKATHLDTEDLENILMDLIKQTRPKEDDTVYDQMLHLLTITQYMGDATDGLLFQECMDKYAKMIDALPDSDYPLKNQFNTTCAILYSKMMQPEKAIESDRKLLKIIGDLKKMYAKKKRIYRNYDISKFICYRRMLSNYEALSPQEIQAIYDSVLMLRDKNIDVRQDMDKHGRTLSYYLMATKQYAKAIPAIQKTLSTDIPQYQRIKFYRMLRDAARATGNKAVLLEALDGYDRNLEQADSVRKASLVKERMLRQQLETQTDTMPRPKLELLERELAKAESTKKTLWVISGALAALLILYMLMYVRKVRGER